MKTVSGANGPLASMPSARAACTAGAITCTSSTPNRPPSPACGLRPATATRGRVAPKASAAACGDADRRQHGVEGHRLDRLAQRHVDRHQHRLQLVVGEHHAHRRQRAARGRERLQHLGVAGIGDAGGGEGFLVDRRRDQALASPRCTRRDRLLDAARRRGAGARVDPCPSGAASEIGRQAVGLQHRRCNRRQAPPRRRRARSAPPAASRRSAPPPGASRRRRRRRRSRRRRPSGRRRR